MMAKRNTFITERYKPFVQEIEAASGNAHRLTDTFFDTVRMMALSIQKPFMLDGGDKLEAEWQSIRDRYDDAAYAHQQRAFSLLMCALDFDRTEFLGHIMERVFNATNQHNGQFLTPVNIATLMGDILVEAPKDEIVRLNDPCCGAGVLVIEGAERFLMHGWEQRNIFVDACDIDGHACDMCYVQLSLLGYAGVVRHQNAMSREYYGTTPIRYTPGFYMHAFPMRLGMGLGAKNDFHDKACGRASEVECPDEPVEGPSVGQGDTETANGHAPSGREGAPS